MSNINKSTVLLLISFFLLAYILPLGVRDLVVPDETRYAEVPREMIAGGDWTTPHINGLRYFEKPVMGYWVHAASLKAFGENNFAVRFPSALSVGLSAVLIFLLMRNAGRREDEEDGFYTLVAPLIFLSCFEVFGVGNTAVLDNLFSFFLTATIAWFFLASEAVPGSRREKIRLLASGVFCGFAFLTKGFLALAVPVLTLAPYLILERRYKDLFRMSWLPILTAVIVSAPWGIMIHLKEPDFWHFFFWNEHIRRFLADNAQHRESFWFFFLTAPAMFISWTFVAPAAVRGIAAQFPGGDSKNRLLRVSLCWLALPFLFFSLSRGKLLTYILPCFPPFAILMASGLRHRFKTSGPNRLFQGGTAVTAILFAVILLAFPLVQFFGFNGFRPFRESWKVMMVINGLAFFVLLCVWSLKSRHLRVKLLLFGTAPLFFFFIVHFTLPDLTREVKSPGPILEKYRQSVTRDNIIISDENSLRAVCWYLKRSDVYILGGSGEMNYGLTYPDAHGRQLDVKAAADLIRKNPGKTILVARVRNAAKWQSQFPTPVFQDQNGPTGYVFWRY
ncbi:phospholipid carrier-dependent glycosyltransferase [uncultured Desulfobacter sp.]|uniref:phospholipid carrier-dependent glycosyltransferase n=1 Tax=uncultured Desulfobacter sp. TaxID=240139 RepID=UPI002AAC1B06|nr:phospholipid carrier-dependent glycosyltransferase [uncultured Desulfobacter sp.]